MYLSAIGSSPNYHEVISLDLEKIIFWWLLSESKKVKIIFSNCPEALIIDDKTQWKLWEVFSEEQ